MKKQKKLPPKKKKETFFKETLHYLLETRKSIVIIIAIFFMAILFGIINANTLSEVINPLLEEIIGKTENLTAGQLMAFIFINNALASLSAIVFGIFLGIFPMITTIFNGVILGYVLERTAQISMLEWWRILPHGIFELPAIFISFGIGLKLGGDFFINYIRQYARKKEMLLILPLAIAMFLPFISFIFFNLQESQFLLPESIMNTVHPAIQFASIALLTVSYFAQTFLFFIIVTFITDKNLRKMQMRSLKQNIRGAFFAFIFIILPLLIIAAIIEGAFIMLG